MPINSSMCNTPASLPITPAKTIISICGSFPTPEQGENNSQTQKESESSSLNTSTARYSPSPLVKDIIENLGNEISAIIRGKDETIDYLFTERELARQNTLKTESLYLKEMANLLQSSGIEIAKSTAQIWALHLKFKGLEREKVSLASAFEAESFQLKKDIVDLRALKTDLEGNIVRLMAEMDEVKSDFEGQLAAKETLLEKAYLKAAENSNELDAKFKHIKELSSEITELKRENNALSREVGELKDRLGGYKRTWEQFKEGMDETLLGDEQRSKKAPGEEA
ncbi:hypothetical protein BKA61DRAFT_680319 [Leptodontidium sp. MPI-SDFR-AT-0119]|nr:hypothetical protein BKA61DRAFT_680319 [Leptodontidium sp. MPI-SDFR-AT-0119]